MSDYESVMTVMSITLERLYHNLFQMQALFKENCNFVQAISIDLKELFLGQHLGFDCADFAADCKENMVNVKEKYKDLANEEKESGHNVPYILINVLCVYHSVIKHANVCIDSFKAVLYDLNLYRVT